MGVPHVCVAVADRKASARRYLSTHYQKNLGTGCLLHDNQALLGCSRGVLVTTIIAAAPGSSVAGYALCPAACLANPTQGSGRPRATHHAQAWIPVTPTTPSSFSSSASCCRRSIQISFGLKRFATFFLSCRRLLGCALQRASLSAASASTTPTFVTCSASGCYYSIL